MASDLSFVVRVYEQEGSEEKRTFLGTGILVTPSHVLTCKHVLKDKWGIKLIAPKTLRVRVGEAMAPLKSRILHDQLDLALIELETPVAEKPVPFLRRLSRSLESRLESTPFYVYGYPEEEKGERLRDYKVTLSLLEFDTKTDILTDAQINLGGVKRGCSGGPVLVSTGPGWACLGMMYEGGVRSPTSRLIAADRAVRFFEREGLPPVEQIAAVQALEALIRKERQEEERRYLDFLARKSRYIYTEGVDRECAELSDVFVMLEAVKSPSQRVRDDIAPVPERAEEMGLEEREADHSRDRRGKGEERSSDPSPSPPVPLSKALGEHKHLIILGEPGTGKTTTLQFIALCFATEGWPKDKLQLSEVRIPVWLELKEYDSKKGMCDFLLQWFATQDVRENVARHWIEDGQLAILLDGLDEVPEKRRTAVLNDIESFAVTREGQRSRIVVTSRIAGYRTVRGFGPEFGHYTIRPFSGPEDALPYVAGWLRVLKGMTQEASIEEAKALLAQAEKRRGLRRILGNPLLLRLAVAVYAEEEELACGRAELYRRYVEEVVWARAKARDSLPWGYTKIERALEAIAWALQTQGEQGVAALAKVIELKVAELDDGRELLDWLRERLGLLASYQRGKLIAFRHLTFREYFVAQRLAAAWEVDEECTWDFLRPRLHHPAWKEPIRLLGGILEGEVAARLVSLILGAQSHYEPMLYRDLFLAAAVIGEGAQVTDDVMNLVTTWLMHLFKHSSQKLQVEALEALGRIGDSRAVDCFIRALESENNVVGRRAAEALVEIGDSRAVDPLIQALEDEDGNVRSWAAEALGRIGDSRAVDPLVRALEDEKSWWMRFTAAKALGRIGDSRAVDSRARVLENIYEVVRLAPAESLDEIGARAVDPLIRALEDEDVNVRSWAAEALGRIGDSRAVDPLVRVLEDKESTVRLYAAEALGLTGDSRAVDPLIRALEDKESSVRSWAATALGRIGDSRAIDPLIQALEDEDGNVRLAATKALGEIGDSRAVDPLIRTLDKKSSWVRRKTAELLDIIGSGFSAVDFLIRALENEKENVRSAAAEALGVIGDSRAVDPLIRALENEKFWVCRRAAEALVRINGRFSAIYFLGRALEDEKSLVRSAAGKVLCAICVGFSAINSLIQALILAHVDENNHVRYAAAEALCKIAEGLDDLGTARSIVEELSDRGAGDTLGRAVARLTELEVEALGPGSPLPM